MANVLEKIRAHDGHLLEISSLKARVAELEAASAKTAELEAALVEGANKLAEIEPLKAEITGLRSQLSAELQISSDLKAKMETVTAAAEAAAAIKVGTAIGATMGVPVAVAPDAGSSQSNRPDFSKLRGLDKTIAVERWESQQAKANNNKQTS